MSDIFQRHLNTVEEWQKQIENLLEKEKSETVIQNLNQLYKSIGELCISFYILNHNEQKYNSIKD